MARSFEDTEVWIKARLLVNEVYAITGKGAFAKDFVLVDQLRRAVVSIMSNIAEGFERGTNAEFIHFLYVAKGSSGEVRSQLVIARDQKYLSEAEFQKCRDICLEISGQLSGLIHYLKNSDLRGEKFKKDVSKDKKAANEADIQ